jgi:hypothetical protein
MLEPKAALLIAALALLPAVPTAGAEVSGTTEPNAPGAETAAPGSGSTSYSKQAPVTETGVRDKLKSLGYSDVSNISHDGSGGWIAKAMKGNKLITVTIGQSGEVAER